MQFCVLFHGVHSFFWVYRYLDLSLSLLRPFYFECIKNGSVLFSSKNYVLTVLSWLYDILSNTSVKTQLELEHAFFGCILRIFHVIHFSITCTPKITSCFNSNCFPTTILVEKDSFKNYSSFRNKSTEVLALETLLPISFVTCFVWKSSYTLHVKTLCHWRFIYFLDGWNANVFLL